MKKFISCVITATLVLSLLSFGFMSVSAVSYWNKDIKFTAAYGTVKIDGKIDTGEWDDTEAIVMKLNNDPLAARGYINYQGEWGGDRKDSDYQGTYKIKWDENYIYFLEERIDDHVNLFGDAEQPWTTDGVLIFTQVPDVPATMNPNGISHHVFYTVGKNGQLGGDARVRVCNMEDNFRETIPIDGVVIASVKTNNGYIVEIAVPWSMYTKDVPNFKGPKAGDIMGLSYVVHDSDTDDVGHVKQFCYAVDNDMLPDVPGGYDFGGWGILELLAPVVVAAPEPVAVEAPAAVVEAVPLPAVVSAPAPAVTSVPATGDFSMILLVVLAIVSAACVMKLKKHSKF